MKRLDRTRCSINADPTITSAKLITLNFGYTSDESRSASRSDAVITGRNAEKIVERIEIITQGQPAVICLTNVQSEYNLALWEAVCGRLYAKTNENKNFNFVIGGPEWWNNDSCIHVSGSINLSDYWYSRVQKIDVDQTSYNVSYIAINCADGEELFVAVARFNHAAKDAEKQREEEAGFAKAMKIIHDEIAKKMNHEGIVTRSIETLRDAQGACYAEGSTAERLKNLGKIDIKLEKKKLGELEEYSIYGAHWDLSLE